MFGNGEKCFERTNDEAAIDLLKICGQNREVGRKNLISVAKEIALIKIQSTRTKTNLFTACQRQLQINMARNLGLFVIVFSLCLIAVHCASESSGQLRKVGV